MCINTATPRRSRGTPHLARSPAADTPRTRRGVPDWSAPLWAAFVGDVSFRLVGLDDRGAERQESGRCTTSGTTRRRYHPRYHQRQQRPTSRPGVLCFVPDSIGVLWWTAGGSNSRPPRCERGALPAELAAQYLLILPRGADRRQSVGSGFDLAMRAWLRPQPRRSTMPHP